MANVLTPLSSLNDLAQLAGLFNWQLQDGSYTNPNKVTTSFYIIDNLQAPIESFIAGEINTYNLVSGLINGNPTDPNKNLFNTNFDSDKIHEEIVRKYAYNRIPYANYDQPVDLGIGGQHITFNIIIFGTMYQTGFTNLIQSLFGNKKNGLGTLQHPVYGTVNNVLPIRVRNSYEYRSLNAVFCELTFLTSDINHIVANNTTSSLVATIGKYFIGTQNAVTSIGGTISAAQGISSNFIAGISSV